MVLKISRCVGSAAQVPVLTLLRAGAIAIACGMLTGCVLRTDYNQIAQERDLCKTRYEQLKNQVSKANRTGEALTQEKTALATEKTVLEAKVATLQTQGAELGSKLREREEEARKLQETYDGLVSNLKNELKAGQIEVKQVRDGLRVNVAQDILFDSGSAALDKNGNGSYNVGMIRGAYHFARPNISSGATQADFFVNHGGGWSADGKTLPPMLDIEYNPYGSTCYGLSQSAMVNWLWSFFNRMVSRTGRYVTIYTTTNWWQTCTGNYGGFGAYSPLFIARYASTAGTLPNGWGFYTFWQYSDSGIFPGDQDVFNGSHDRLIALALG